MTPQPVSIKGVPKLPKVPQIGGKSGRAPAIPPVSKLKIAPVGKSGFHVTHFGPQYHGGVTSPRSFVFTNSDKMFNHVRKTAAVMKPAIKVKRGHPLG